MNRAIPRTLVWAALATVVAFACLSSSLPARAATAVKPFENAVLRVDVVGKGRPMVLIPGLTCPGEVWRETAAHYAANYQCHLVTLGGFAGRPRFEGPFLDTARDSLAAYIRAQGLSRPVIVGHSLGGVLAMDLVTSSLTDAGPVVILDALPFLGGAGDTAATVETARKAMEPMWKVMRGQTQEAYASFQLQSPYLKSMVAPGPNYDRVVKWAASSDRIAVADAMYELTSRDLRARLANLHSPMLVLGSWYGMRQYTTREATEGIFRRQYAQAPHVTLALADTARHFLMLDDPKWTWARMDAFLSANDRSSAKTP